MNIKSRIEVAINEPIELILDKHHSRLYFSPSFVVKISKVGHSGSVTAEEVAWLQRHGNIQARTLTIQCGSSSIHGVMLPRLSDANCLGRILVENRLERRHVEDVASHVTLMQESSPNRGIAKSVLAHMAAENLDVQIHALGPRLSDPLIREIRSKLDLLTRCWLHDRSRIPTAVHGNLFSPNIFVDRQVFFIDPLENRTRPRILPMFGDAATLDVDLAIHRAGHLSIFDRLDDGAITASVYIGIMIIRCMVRYRFALAERDISRDTDWRWRQNSMIISRAPDVLRDLCDLVTDICE